MFIFHLCLELLAVEDNERLAFLCKSFERYTGAKVHPNVGLILFLHFVFT